MSRSTLLGGPSVTLWEGSGGRQRKLTSRLYGLQPRIGFSRDWEIYHDEGKEDERREKAGMLKHAGLIGVSFRRLFLGGLLPSRARFRFAG